MIKKQLAVCAAVALLATGLAFASVEQDKVMYKQADGTYVVNTTSLASNVRGFKGTTPLEVYIKNNKVVKVVALKNRETPKYFSMITSKMLPKYAGLKVGKTASVDGVTGATFSSKAVKTNVEAAVNYYKKHK